MLKKIFMFQIMLSYFFILVLIIYNLPLFLIKEFSKRLILINDSLVNLFRILYTLVFVQWDVCTTVLRKSMLKKFH